MIKNITCCYLYHNIFTEMARVDVKALNLKLRIWGSGVRIFLGAPFFLRSNSTPSFFEKFGLRPLGRHFSFNFIARLTLRCRKAASKGAAASLAKKQFRGNIQSQIAHGSKICYSFHMSKVEKLSVAFTHDMAGLVKASVADGEYGSVSEAVREAMRDWAAKRERKRAEIEYLRGAWKQGVESGPAQHSTIDDLLAEAHHRHNS
jgi:antitoxin ParD1/3/4